MNNSIIIPEDWTFHSENIASQFDSHVREQLPWYDMLTDAVAHIARHYIPQGGLVYDIGASTGNIGQALKQTLNSRDARLVAIDSSEEMSERYDRSIGPFFVADACDFDFEPFDLAICFLSLMFIEPARRQELLAKLRAKVKTGGALVIVDKCEPVGGYVSVVMSRLALAEKLKSGAKPADILAKELSLSGVQRPISPSTLTGAQEFFRFGDFAGWIIEAENERI